MTDPFTALSSPAEPVDPGDEVRARIRARIQERLGRDHGVAADPDASTAITATAGGQHRSTTTTSSTDRTTVTSVSPYHTVSDARAAIDYYVEVFGAEPLGDVYVGADGRVGHAEFRLGDLIVMIADEHPEFDVVGPESLGGTSVAMQVMVPDAALTVGRAQVRGATVIREVEEQFYGDVAGAILDPWGHRWTVRTPRPSALDRDELVERSGDLGYQLVPTGEADTGPDVEAASTPTVRSRQGELGYLSLPVADLGRGMAFFGELLGWEFSEPGSEGGVHILNANFPGSVGPGQGDKPAVTFVVDDLPGAVATVRRLGGTATDPAGPDAWHTSMCTDGEGLEFTLVQAAPGPYPMGNEL
jgi:uncharacterized glyoxalase superfamily protein PhnB